MLVGLSVVEVYMSTARSGVVRKYRSCVYMKRPQANIIPFVKVCAGGPIRRS